MRRGKPSTNEKPRTFGECTMCKSEALRAGWACPCGGFWVSAGAFVGWGKTVHEWKATNKRMDSAQTGIASDWAGLSLRRVVGFGERVRGVVNGLCRGLTDGNGWTACSWKSASVWVGLSVRRVVGFGGRVCGGKKG